MYKDKLAHLVQSHIHPSLWFIAEGPLAEHQWTPPFDHSLRSDVWTARLHDHQIGAMWVSMWMICSLQVHDTQNVP